MAWGGEGGWGAVQECLEAGNPGGAAHGLLACLHADWAKLLHGQVALARQPCWFEWEMLMAVQNDSKQVGGP